MSTKTRARTRTDFLALTISTSPGKPESSPAGPNYRYKVAVDSDATGARIYFDFHASVNDRTHGIDQLDREALLYALWAFTNDATVGQLSFSDYCNEFGENDDSLSARRTWEACKAALAKFQKLFHDQREPGWLLEQLEGAGIA